MEIRGSPVPTFQIIIRLSLPGGGDKERDGHVSVLTGVRTYQTVKESSVCVCSRRGIPAVSSMLRAVGCHVTMPTRLECPSKTTMGSERGRTSE